MKKVEIFKKHLIEEEKLKKNFKIERLLEIPKIIAFLDSSYYKENIISCFLFYDFLNKKVLKKKYIIGKVKVPYVPTYLSLREAPFYIKGLENEIFDLIIVDGQGIAHPRRMGIATYLGTKLNKPSIGIAKSLLYGKYEEVGESKGDFSFIKDENGDILGFVYRTKENVKPIFVSIGNLIDVEGALFIIKNLNSKYRIPEPLREVDIYSRNLRRSFFENIHNW
ncbi:MAG: endonuclease V [Caldisericia bacterium]|nr:endonuclease V [Caldisericia bacterium]